MLPKSPSMSSIKDDSDEELPCVTLSQSTHSKSDLEMPPASEVASLRAREDAAERALRDLQDYCNDPLLISLSRSTSQGSSGEEGEAALTARVSALQVTEQRENRGIKDDLRMLTAIRDNLPGQSAILNEYIRVLNKKPEKADTVTELILRGVSSSIISGRPPRDVGVCVCVLRAALHGRGRGRVARASLHALLNARTDVSSLAIAISAAVEDIPLHCFPNPGNVGKPEELERFRIWVLRIGGDIVGEENMHIYRNRFVCHRHFEDIFVYPTKRLNRLAIPTLHIPDIPLHCFPNPGNVGKPEELERFRIWVLRIGGDIVGEENMHIYRNRFVCHRHFEDIFVYPTKRLNRLAIPTLHIPDIPLHCFPNPGNVGKPEELERFRIWVLRIGGDIVGEENMHIYRNRFVCHRHFEDIFVYPTKRLNRLAIPTLHIPDAEQLLAAHDAARDGTRRGADRLAATLLAHATARVLRQDTPPNAEPPSPLSSESVSLVRSSWRKLSTRAQLTLLRCAGRALAAVGDIGDMGDKGDMDMGDIEGVSGIDTVNPVKTEETAAVDAASTKAAETESVGYETVEYATREEIEGGAALLAALSQPLPRASAFHIDRQQVLTNVSKLQLLFRSRLVPDSENETFLETHFNCSQTSVDSIDTLIKLDTPVKEETPIKQNHLMLTPKKEIIVKIPMELVKPMRLDNPIKMPDILHPSMNDPPINDSPMKAPSVNDLPNDAIVPIVKRLPINDSDIKSTPITPVKGMKATQLKLDGFFKQITPVKVEKDVEERSPERKRIRRERPERRCGYRSGRS